MRAQFALNTGAIRGRSCIRRAYSFFFVDSQMASKDLIRQSIELNIASVTYALISCDRVLIRVQRNFVGNSYIYGGNTIRSSSNGELTLIDDRLTTSKSIFNKERPLNENEIRSRKCEKPIGLLGVTTVTRFCVTWECQKGRSHSSRYKRSNTMNQPRGKSTVIQQRFHHKNVIELQLIISWSW